MGQSGETDEEKVLKGVVRVELVENPSDYIDAVLKKVRREYLARTYKIPADWKDHNEFLDRLAQKSGKLLKGGEADLNTVAKMVLNGEWQQFLILRMSLVKCNPAKMNLILQLDSYV